MKTRLKIEDDPATLSLGLILCDQLLFSLYFQKSDLSLEPTIAQKQMFLDQSKRVLLCTSRNVAKTICLIGRMLRDLVTYLPAGHKTDEEILFFAPAEGHLMPPVDRLIANLTNQPFFKAVIRTLNRSDKPKIVTKTGLSLHCRI